MAFDASHETLPIIMPSLNIVGWQAEGKTVAETPNSAMCYLTPVASTSIKCLMGIEAAKPFVETFSFLLE